MTPTLTSFAASGATLSSPTPTFAGIAEPGSTITITDGSGTIIADTIVNPDGSFTVTLATPLAEGTHTLSVASTDLYGNVSFVLIVIVVIDISLPAAPVVLSPLAGATLTTTTPTFAGTAEPGSIVTVTDWTSGTIFGTGMTDELGSYSFTLSTPLPNGAVSLNITATDIAGNVSAPTDGYQYTIAASVPPTAPTVTNPSATGSWNPTDPITGSGTPGNTILITDGSGTVIGSGVVDASGSYSVLVTATELTPTPLTLSQCDSIVSTSCTATAVPLTITIDTTPPSVPPTPGTLGGDATAPFASADPTPTITGSGTP